MRIISASALIIACIGLTGCGDKDKKEFMNGCTDGSTNSLAIKLCSCAYGKMKTKYGGKSDWLKNAQNSSPQEFTTDMNETVTSCMRL